MVLAVAVQLTFIQLLYYRLNVIPLLQRLEFVDLLAQANSDTLGCWFFNLAFILLYRSRRDGP